MKEVNISVKKYHQINFREEQRDKEAEPKTIRPPLENLARQTCNATATIKFDRLIYSQFTHLKS